MGQNLALNIASKGFRISVWNRSESKVDDTTERAKKEGNLPLDGHKDLSAFVQSIKKPRKIIMLIQAGPPVDKAMEPLLPLLEAGDLLIDGGNEWYENTDRRTALCESKGIRYMGMGVSGGEEGARHGPSLMPGGTKEGWDIVKPILMKIAAQVDDGPCVSYIGPGGSGNYVKMVHNGIEYGDMQLIAEAYAVLKQMGGLTNPELQNLFKEWNKGELKSFLIEITSDIFGQKDDKTDGYLVDKILDVAGSKGTGKWTIQEAAEHGVPCPTMQAALDMRYMSTFKAFRQRASGKFKGPATKPQVTQSTLIDDVRNALYCAKICSYAQGLMLLQTVSNEKGWGLNLGEISRTWKGGCIIRAVFLDRIKKAFDRNPHMDSLLMDDQFADEIQQREVSWRRIVNAAQAAGIPIPALSASLCYFDAYRSATLPVNLVQGQRDYFGAHTYKRTDDEGGPYHTQWTHFAQT
ncbi:unnamed protein product [Vitrella brassicaformis CCMP3155]|uniref:6-phosphogluconate dehydrogenase, decarboxylating n=2 Tax=Vitrella brassicaformis TaxID=1169539 RepID=A0A0G4H747_VITBC|nr:unnamed protein product [Vitrella brassicaformis CCMP3155]|eukprot:CEM39714.1 unnamed protein product [Vitrella brassicaformis CCMP3155]